MLIEKDMLPLSGRLRYDAKLVTFKDVFLLLLTAGMSLPASLLILMPKVKLVILVISSGSEVSRRNTVGTQVPLCCPTRSCIAPRTSTRPIVLALCMRTTFAFAHALLDNVHQLALQGNDVQAFTRPAFNWQQLCRHRNTRTLIHLSVSSLRAEEITVCVALWLNYVLYMPFMGATSLPMVSEVCLIRYAFEPLKTTSTFQ